MKPISVMKGDSPKTQRGLARQKKLLETAIQVFLEHGYERASLDKIILEAGGSRSTIYKLFGSKKGLFLACLSNLVDEIYFAYAEHYDENRSWQEELRVFGKVFLKSILDDRAIGTSRLIFSQAAKEPDIGNWYYKEGAQLSYLCFAKVLENKLPLDLEDLIPIAEHFIEMLKSDLYMKRLCSVDAQIDEETIDKEVGLCSDIIACYIQQKLQHRSK